MRLTPPLLVATVVLLLAGCGGATPPPAAAGGSEPVTPRALGAVAAELIGEPDRGQEDGSADDLGAGAVGATLRYGSDGEYDGDLLAVVVSPETDRTFTDCGELADRVDGCASVDEATLSWEEVEPEEDPGVVLLALPKDGATVVVYQAGADIEGDPRELDLAISVEDMVAVAADPRVDLTTTPATVAAGDDLAWWRD